MKNLIIVLFLIGVLVGCGNKETGKLKMEPDPEHATEAHKKQSSDSDYTGRGLKYAQAVQGALGKTLQTKILESGPEEAIDYCNLNALSISDSIGRDLGAEINRISDRPRNPKNKASSDEITFIQAYQGQLASGSTPEPLLIHKDSTTYFYYPILTNNLCLQCHGSPGAEITPDVFARLQQLYPEDQAISYSANQVRGLWKVAFIQKQP